jgi:hypothetical protein
MIEPSLLWIHLSFVSAFAAKETHPHAINVSQGIWDFLVEKPLSFINHYAGWLFVKCVPTNVVPEGSQWKTTKVQANREIPNNFPVLVRCGCSSNVMVPCHDHWSDLEQGGVKVECDFLVPHFTATMSTFPN